MSAIAPEIENIEKRIIPHRFIDFGIYCLRICPFCKQELTDLRHTSNGHYDELEIGTCSTCERESLVKGTRTVGLISPADLRLKLQYPGIWKKYASFV